MLCQPACRQVGAVLAGVKVGAQIFAPGAPGLAHQAALAEQRACGAGPGAPFPQRAIAAQVQHRLAQHIAEEHHRDAAEPGDAPLVVAAQRLVKVEGGVLVLGLFGAVPLPHRRQARLGALQYLGVGQQPFGQQGGEVLVGSGHGQRMAWIGACKQLHALLRTRGPFIGEALLVEVAVEQCVDAAVRGFLPDKAAHLVGKLRLLVRGQGLVAVTHGVDEELLAHRKAHRQRIEQRRAKRVATAPVARKRRLQVDQQAADNEFGHEEGSWRKGGRTVVHRFGTLQYRLGLYDADQLWYCQVPRRIFCLAICIHA